MGDHWLSCFAQHFGIPERLFLTSRRIRAWKLVTGMRHELIINLDQACKLQCSHWQMPHDLRLALGIQPLHMLRNLLRGHLHSCGLPDSCSPCSSWPFDLPSASAAAAVEMREDPHLICPRLLSRHGLCDGCSPLSPETLGIALRVLGLDLHAQVLDRELMFGLGAFLVCPDEPSRPG